MRGTRETTYEMTLGVRARRARAVAPLERPGPLPRSQDVVVLMGR
ncbi:hypothetical protein [Streptomyces sp. NPDC057199]